MFGTKGQRTDMLLEEIRSEMKVVLEHVTITDSNVEVLKKDNQKIQEKLDIIDLKLMGKADAITVDKLDRRVSRLEVAHA